MDDNPLKAIAMEMMAVDTARLRTMTSFSRLAYVIQSNTTAMERKNFKSGDFMIYVL